MTHNKFWTAVSKALTAVTMTLIVTLVFATSASASMFKILYQFTKIEDGELPSGTLIMDASGNLYGTTSEGGSLTSNGTVFKLTPTAGGDWTFTVLYTFSDTPTEGGVPYGGVIFDATGNLYGTTGAGGIYSGGTVFELSPTASGDWKEKILHNFGSGED
ncbi:MAG: choice-of-anchor tandem repeat GloVer-containing protein, partial [Candidatus Sulfotelmatobacter sp.]